MRPVSKSWGPRFYSSEDHGEYVRLPQEYPESICDVLVISQQLSTTHDLGRNMEENNSSLKEGEVRVRGICKFPDDSEDVSMQVRDTRRKKVNIGIIEREKTSQFIGMPRLGREDGCAKDYSQLGPYVQIEARKKLYEGDYNDGRVSTSRVIKANKGGWSQYDAVQCWHEIQTLWDEK